MVKRPDRSGNGTRPSADLLSETRATMEIWRECYAQCFQEKRHYDLLSWSIGAAMMAFSAFVMGQILSISADMRLGRILFALFVFPFFLIWIWIYERNRAWGEISNEVAKDIERRFGVDGIQLRYMRASLSRETVRTNIDLPERLRILPGDFVPGRPRPLKMRVRSMHFALYILALLVAAAPMVVALSSAISRHALG